MAGALNKQGRLLYFYGLGRAPSYPRMQEASLKVCIDMWGFPKI